MDRDVDYDFRVALAIDARAEPLAPDIAVATALENRIELRDADAAVDQAEREVGYARHQLLPQFDVSLALTRRETAGNLRNAFGVDRFEPVTFFSVSTPLDRTVEAAGVRTAAIERNRRVRARDTLRRRIAQEARRALRLQQRLANRLDNAGVTVEFAEREVELANLRFQRGLSNNLDVVNAQAALLNATTRRFAVLADLAVSRLALRATLGTLGRAHGRAVESRMAPLQKRALGIAGLGLICVTALFAVRSAAPIGDPALAWTVDRGDIVADLVESGTLRAAGSITYRSPVNGRELEIIHLAPEGLRVEAGDLIARLETRDLEADLQQAENNVHDVEFARQVADLELLEATAGYDSTIDGEDALTLEESRTSLALTERKVDRLRREVRNLEPLLEKGFITGDELERSQAELEAAEADLAIARRRAGVLVEQTHPLNQRRAELQLAQKRAQRGRRQPPADRRSPAGGGDHRFESSVPPSMPSVRGWSSTKSSWRRRRGGRSGSATG